MHNPMSYLDDGVYVKDHFTVLVGVITQGCGAFRFNESYHWIVTELGQ